MFSNAMNSRSIKHPMLKFKEMFSLDVQVQLEPDVLQRTIKFHISSKETSTAVTFQFLAPMGRPSPSVTVKNGILVFRQFSSRRLCGLLFNLRASLLLKKDHWGGT
jgi:hypothetical protein